jgi:hypothetical protein
MGPDSPHRVTSQKQSTDAFWPPKAHAFPFECQVAVSTPVNPQSSGHSESARFFGSKLGVPSLI